MNDFERYYTHGHCMDFAYALHKLYGYTIETLARILPEYNSLIHVYCTYMHEGITYYVDVFGTTNCYANIIEPFKHVDFECGTLEDLLNRNFETGELQDDSNAFFYHQFNNENIADFFTWMNFLEVRVTDLLELQNYLLDNEAMYNPFGFVRDINESITQNCRLPYNCYDCMSQVHCSQEEKQFALKHYLDKLSH